MGSSGLTPSVQPADFWHLMAMRSARLANGTGGQDRTFPGIFVG